GSYQVNGLQIGDYHVYITLYGVTGATTLQRITVTGPMTHDFDLAGTSLTGRVIDSDTGQALSDAVVQLRAATSDNVIGNRQAMTDSAGRFAFDLLQDGTYHLGTQRSQYAAKQQDVVVPGPDIEIPLSRTSATVIHVVDSVTGIGLTADLSANDEHRVQVGN